MKDVIGKDIATYIYNSFLCVIVATLLLIPTGVASLQPSRLTNNNNLSVMDLMDTIIVDDDGSADYTTIQAAINNATPGDYIIVKDGLYGDQLTINVANLTISAASGETPTIYVGAYPIGINVTAPEVFFQGFEIFGNGEPISGPYPVIQASTGSDGLSIINNTFKVITGLIGQVVLRVSANVQDITFSKNIILNYTMGVVLEPNAQALISNDNEWISTTPIIHAAQINTQDTYYGSIQSAINHAEIGQIVNVLSGIFYENIIIDRPLTLKGLQAGVNPNEYRFEIQSTIHGEATHAVSIASGIAHVLIDGFTITLANKSSTENGAGILIGMNTQDITIQNNIIHDITDGPGNDTLTDETYGIMVYGRDPIGGQSEILIKNNLIQNVEEYGIAINDKTSEVTIQGNVISNLTASNHSDFPYASWPHWVCAAIHLGGQVGPLVNVTVIGNTLTTNVTGNGNTSPAGGGISFAGIWDWTNPFLEWQGFKGITIRNNKIYDNTMGIITLIGEFSDTPQIHYNSIENNTVYGINNTLTTNISATNNWWGTPLGPYHPVTNPNGTGDYVSDYVLFEPWSEVNDYTPPELQIIQPVPGIYILNNLIIKRFPYPFAFGPITIQALASDSISGIYKVEFYLKYHGGTALKQTTYDVPFEWLWNEEVWGFYEIEVVAYDNAGFTTSATIEDIFVINLGYFIP